MMGTYSKMEAFGCQSWAQKISCIKASADMAMRAGRAAAAQVIKFLDRGVLLRGCHILQLTTLNDNKDH